MKETKVMDQIQKDLIKKYHTLAGQLGMTTEERSSLLALYNVESSRDLSQHQLIDVCACLARELDKIHGRDSMDALRKRLIAVIGSTSSRAVRVRSVSLTLREWPAGRVGYASLTASPGSGCGVYMGRLASSSRI